MKLGQMFPSKYLKADDLQGRRVTLTIASVTVETLGDESKPVVYFVGKDKGLVLNKGNGMMIAALAGTDETDDWHGTRIRLYATPVQFQGKLVNALRVEAAPQDAPAPTPARRPQPVAAPVEVEESYEGHPDFGDDQVPF